MYYRHFANMKGTIYGNRQVKTGWELLLYIQWCRGQRKFYFCCRVRNCFALFPAIFYLSIPQP
jgi:hypothetical protein